MVATDGRTMVATDGRTMVVTDGLINGGNGVIIQSDHTEQSYSAGSRSDHTEQPMADQWRQLSVQWQ